jgi:pyruvate dehydrogenase (quinone)
MCGLKHLAIAARFIWGVLGNVKDTLDAVLPSIKEKTDSGHLSEALSDYKKTRRDLDALAESGPYSDIIHPQYVTRMVSELAADLHL